MVGEKGASNSGARGGKSRVSDVGPPTGRPLPKHPPKKKKEKKTFVVCAALMQGPVASQEKKKIAHPPHDVEQRAPQHPAHSTLPPRHPTHEI